MRQRGFTLAEVGLAVSIVALMTGITLGAANVVRENGAAEEMRNLARTVQVAVEEFRGMYGYTVRYSGDETSSWQSVWWWTFMDNTQTNNASEYLFTNPYTGASEGGWQVRNSADGGYPVGSVTGVTYSSAAYPLTNVGGNSLIGRILYLPKGDGSAAQRAWATVRVWNGVTDVYFREYAIQAIDSKGYPVCTIGL